MRKTLTKVTFGNAYPLPLPGNSNTGRIGQGRFLDWLGIHPGAIDQLDPSANRFGLRHMRQKHRLTADAQKCHSSAAEADAFRILCLMHGKA
jgi:hypothetical protein